MRGGHGTPAEGEYLLVTDRESNSSRTTTLGRVKVQKVHLCNTAVIDVADVMLVMVGVS